MKIYVKDAEEREAARTALNVLDSALDVYDGADTDEDINIATAFLERANIVVGTGELDTALMGEIGKAYKEQYENAKIAGDKDMENRMVGAMFAVKKIMEMVNDPKY